MTAEQWVLNNLDIVISPFGTNAISWVNGIETEVSAFLAMFGDAIQTALDTGEDVRQAIRESDNGRGFADLV